MIKTNTDRIAGVPWLILLWIDQATQDLTPRARKNIGDEMEFHFREAVLEALQNGSSPEQAAHEAIKRLGSPESARTHFNKTHLTEIEEAKLARLTQPTHWFGELLFPAVLIFMFFILGKFVIRPEEIVNGTSHVSPVLWAGFWGVLTCIASFVTLLGTALVFPTNLKLRWGMKLCWISCCVVTEAAAFSLVMKAPLTLSMLLALLLHSYQLWSWFRLYKKLHPSIEPSIWPPHLKSVRS